MQGLRHEKNAAQFIVDVCSRYPGEVHILALGPLTNIALAAKLDEQLGQKLVCPDLPVSCFLPNKALASIGRIILLVS